jgi:GntR family transcriptional regulator
MKTDYDINMTSAQRTLEPVIATKFEAELLIVEVGAPLMMERRLGFDQNKNCVEFSKDLYRGDRFRFIVPGNGE